MAKKEKELKELQQTRGTFKLSGKVKRIDNDKAYKQGEGKYGKNEGVPSRSLNFVVQTSENNEVKVGAFSYEPKEVFLWNTDLAKKAKEDGKKYKGLRVPYDEWLETREELAEEGFTVLQSRVGLDYDEDGKLITESLPLYLTLDKLYKNLENGDDIHVEGDIRHSTFETQDGKTIHQTQYSLTRVFRSAKPIDFDAEDFEERAYFEDEIVYVGADKHPSTREKLVITGRTIDYHQNFLDNEYIIDATEDKSMGTFGNNIKKRFKFGDKVTVYGKIVNRVEIEEVEETEDSFLASLGGKSKPSHAQKWGVRNYVQEMSIEGVDDYTSQYYTEEDFASGGFIDDETEEKEDLNSQLGGKKRKTEVDDDPFADNNKIEIEEDDLPF